MIGSLLISRNFSEIKIYNCVLIGSLRSKSNNKVDSVTLALHQTLIASIEDDWDGGYALKVYMSTSIDNCVCNDDWKESGTVD